MLTIEVVEAAGTGRDSGVELLELFIELSFFLDIKAAAAQHATINAASMADANCIVHDSS
jgi:hypothetical protein